MELLNIHDIKELKANENNICISILIPTTRGGKDTLNGMDSKRLKSHLQEVSNTLEKEHGFNDSQIDEFIKPIKELIEDSNFWRNQSDGLAIYLSEGFFKYYSLPISFDPKHYVMKEFMIAPISGLLNKNEHFYILQFSKNTVKLYDATRFSISEIELSHLDLPEDYTEIVNMKATDRTLQQHSDARGEQGVFHGQGASKDAEDNKLQLLFRLVNKEIQEVFLNQHQPLLLAGVGSLVSEFKKHLHYNYILDETLSGNYEHEDPKMLHERAMSIMSPILKEQKATNLKQLFDGISTGKVSMDFKEVVEGAMYEKVDTLYFKSNACPTWGSLEGEPATATIHDEYKEGDICLMNKAVVDALINKGTVYQLLSTEETELDHSVAAKFRF